MAPIICHEGQTIAAVELFLTQMDLRAFMRSVAVEVNDACYCQSDYVPTEKDHNELAADLQIEKIEAWPEDVVFIILSPTFLPDMYMSVQVMLVDATAWELEIHAK